MIHLAPFIITSHPGHTVTATTRLTQHCCSWEGHRLIVATCTCGWQTRAGTKHQATVEAEQHTRRTHVAH